MSRRRRINISILAGIALCLLPGLSVNQVLASESRITKVSLDIVTDFELGDSIEDQDILIHTDSSEYQIDEWRLLNEEAVWEGSVVPVAEIVLSQTGELKFSYIGADNLTIKGTRFAFISSKRSEEDTVLNLKIKLPPIEAEAKGTEEIRIDSNGMASWALNEHTSLTTVQVFFNGNRIQELSTYGTILSLQDVITRPGSYYVKLSGVSKYDGKSRSPWEESESMYFDQEMISSFSEPKEELAGAWLWQNGIWSYVNPGEHLAAAQWQEIEGKWYFFNAQGAMVTGWVDWDKSRYYCAEDGSMLTDSVTPDGYRVGADGAVVGKED